MVEATAEKIGRNWEGVIDSSETISYDLESSCGGRNHLLEVRSIGWIRCGNGFGKGNKHSQIASPWTSTMHPHLLMDRLRRTLWTPLSLRATYLARFVPRHRDGLRTAFTHPRLDPLHIPRGAAATSSAPEVWDFWFRTILDTI